MLTLFYAPGACSLASHIILEEIGQPFETVRLDLSKGDQRKPEYLAVNPQGRVPALLGPSGVLTETPAILTYLSDRNPERGLLPQAPFERALAISRMSWLASSQHIAFAQIFRAARFIADEAQHPAVKAKGLETVNLGFDELDHWLDDREWAFGSYSVVDPYLAVMRRWGFRVGLDMTRWPALVAHAARVAARPAAQAALAREGIALDA